MGGMIALFFIRSVVWVYALSPAPLRRFWGEALGLFLRLTGIRAKVVRTNRARQPRLQPPNLGQHIFSFRHSAFDRGSFEAYRAAQSITIERI